MHMYLLDQVSCLYKVIRIYSARDVWITDYLCQNEFTLVSEAPGIVSVILFYVGVSQW